MANRINEIVDEVVDELFRAREKFPTWPSDPLHAIAVVGEEFGELTKATLQHVYEPQKSSFDDVREEENTYLRSVKLIEIKKSPTADTRTCDVTKVERQQLLDSSRQHIADVAKAMPFFSAVARNQLQG